MQQFITAAVQNSGRMRTVGKPRVCTTHRDCCSSWWPPVTTTGDRATTSASSQDHLQWQDVASVGPVRDCYIIRTSSLRRHLHPLSTGLRICGPGLRLGLVLGQKMSLSRHTEPAPASSSTSSNGDRWDRNSAMPRSSIARSSASISDGTLAPADWAGRTGNQNQNRNECQGCRVGVT